MGFGILLLLASTPWATKGSERVTGETAQRQVAQ